MYHFPSEGIVPPMDEWIALVKQKMREQKVTQEELAERIGRSQGAIAHWLNQRRVPDCESMNRVLQELGMGYLEVAQVLRAAESQGEYDSSLELLQDLNERSVERFTEPIFRYPRMNWAAATSERPSPADHGDGGFMLSDYDARGAAYWLEVCNDAMTALTGLCIPEGMWVLVDPKAVAHVGSLIIARPRGAGAIFRQLDEEGGVRYLRPLNPTYPKLPLTETCSITGVVVRAAARLDTVPAGEA